MIDKQDLSPDRIWMISFTRTAMREIRDRIADHGEDPADAYSVKLATLDSHAWAIQSGFSEEDRTLGSYNENIQRMRQPVWRDEAVAECLEAVEHLIVDEAQDLAGHCQVNWLTRYQAAISSIQTQLTTQILGLPELVIR